MALKKTGNKKTGPKKKTAKKTGDKASKKTAAPSGPVTPKRENANEYTVELMERHARWIEAVSAAYGRTPEHQIEKIIREAYAMDPNRASGSSAVKDSPHHDELLAER